MSDESTSTLHNNHLEFAIILVCGLPGSGKSTLAKSITDHYSTKRAEVVEDARLSTNLACAHEKCEFFDHVVHIEYDRITECLSKGITEGTNVDMMKGDFNKDSSFTTDLEAWRKTRTVALDVLRNTLQSELESMTHKKTLTHTKARRVLIIMDDNFHLRSMRREAHQVCQAFVKICNKTAFGTVQSVRVGMSILYVNTLLETCLRQNEKRRRTPNYIQPKTITNMSKTLEPPNQEKAKFESCVVVTDSSQDRSRLLDSVHQCLLKSLSSHIVKEVEITPQRSQKEIAEERKQTQKSQMHQLDLLTRMYVGVACGIEPSLAKSANMARKKILNEAKEDFQTDVDTGESDYVKANGDVIREKFLCFTFVTERKSDTISDAIEIGHNEFMRKKG